MVRWCDGVMVRWCDGAMVRWCDGAMKKHISVGDLVHRISKFMEKMKTGGYKIDRCESKHLLLACSKWLYLNNQIEDVMRTDLLKLLIQIGDGSPCEVGNDQFLVVINQMYMLYVEDEPDLVISSSEEEFNVVDLFDQLLGHIRPERR